eukprot:scaffold60808_cov66-Phaeocystis_antarctica.AAC.7
MPERNGRPPLSSPLPATCQVLAPPRPCAWRRHRRRAAARLDPPSRLRRAYDAAAALTPCRLTCPHEPLPRPRRFGGADTATPPDLPMCRCRARGAAAAPTLRLHASQRFLSL